MNDKPTIKPIDVDNPFLGYVAKTIPLAFDESMSYYEVLCNLRELVGQTISSLTNTNNGFTELQNLFNELEDYVNSYFDNLDVQEEINHKLDEMATDGSLTDLIDDYLTPYINAQNQEIQNFKESTTNDINQFRESTTNNINQFKSQINNQMSVLESGSPLTANSISEMTNTSKVYVNTTDGHWYYYDGTSWIDGGVYQSVYVSENDNVIKKIKLSQEKSKNGYETFLDYANFEIGGIEQGQKTGNQHRVMTNDILTFDRDLILNIDSEYYLSIHYFVDNQYSSREINLTGMHKVLKNTYFKLMIRKIDETDVQTPDIIDFVSKVTFATIIEDEIEENKINIKNIDENTKILNNIIKKGIYNQIQTSPISTGGFSGRIGEEIEFTDNTSWRRISFNAKANTNYKIEFRPRIDMVITTPYILVVNENNIIIDEFGFTNDQSGNTHTEYIPIEQDCVVYVRGYGNDISSRLKVYEQREMLYYTVPNNVSQELFFTETEYASSHEMQGVCNDGTYLYYCMHDSTSDNANSVVGKIEIASGNLILEKCNHIYRHANGLCYNPNDNTLLIAGMTTTGIIYKVDADTLEYIDEFTLSDKFNQYWQNIAYENTQGIGAIGYSDELEKFVGLIRKNTINGMYGFAIFDKDFNLEKLIKCKQQHDYVLNGGIDCDDKYIYMCEGRDSQHPNNYLIIYDYNGNVINKDITFTSDNNLDAFEGITKINDNEFYITYAKDKIYKMNVTNTIDVTTLEIASQYNLN